MDERIINGAAIAAISGLELDCEIKEVCRPAGDDEWCIQFSGKYGRFCDEFKNQFGEENSPAIVREKIKAHLLKQVTKIRSSTGRRRAARADTGEERRESTGDLLSAPVKLVGEMLGRASGIAGEVIKRASSVAETARAAVTAMTPDIGPVTTETQGSGGATLEVRETVLPARKTVKKAKKSSGRTKKAMKRASSRASKRVKKTLKAAKKSAKKSVRKITRKKSGRKKAKTT